MAKVQSEIESSRLAYTLGVEKYPDTYLFKREEPIGDGSVRWTRIRESDRTDISSGKERFLTLTKDDIRSILGVDHVPLVYTQDQTDLISHTLTLRYELIDNPNLTTRQKEQVLRRLRRGIGSRKKKLEADLDKNGWERRVLLAEKDVLESFAGPLMLQRPTGTVFHKARQSFEEGDMLMPYANFSDHDDSVPITEHPGMRGGYAGDHHIFLVEHNWAGAFADSNALEGEERRMPYPLTAFEFQINSRRIVVNIVQWDDRDKPRPVDLPPHTSLVTIQTKAGWMLPMAYEFQPHGFVIPQHISSREEIKATKFVQVITPLMALIHAQIRAILIMLSAEVAETPVVRIPHKLNEARVKKGKKPMLDYHVVSLAKRARYESLPTGPYHEPSHRKRLHWRRGHDRHYANHKVWIKRQLVGNPDLGFIDKHYRL